MVRNLNKHVLFIGLGPIIQSYIRKRIYAKIDVISDQTYSGKIEKITSYSNYHEIDLRKIDLVVVGVRYERLNTIAKEFLDLILDELAKSDKCAQIIVLSSVSVYGDSDEFCTENHLRLGKTKYASGKIELENSITRVFDSERFNILRIANIYGSFGQNDVVNNLLTSMVTARELRLPSKDNFRDFIYVDDFFEILDYLIESPTISPSILNIGTGISVSIYQLCLILTNLLDKDFRTLDVKKVIESDHINSFIDVSLLKSFYSKPLSTLDGALEVYVPIFQHLFNFAEKVK